MDLPRRSVLLLGVGTLLTGCASSRTPGASATPTATPSAGPSSTPTAGPSASASASAVALPDVPRWEASSNDKVPAAKTAAVRAVERAQTSADQVVQVIDAQYGGLLSTTACVLVVTRSWRRAGQQVVAGGRTYDVRVSLHAGSWRVDATYPSQPGPRSASLSADARRVLSSSRIDLPPAARRDVESGQVHDTALAAMLTLAGTFRVGLSVVRSGHPLHVFGTDRLSDHPQGRAFDTWHIDGHAVVDPRTPRSLVTDYMHAAAAAGSYNVGGPYLLGAAPQWFSDDTHHDHVHAGFST